MTLMTVSGFNSSFTEFIIHLDFHAGKFQLLCIQVPEFIQQASFVTTCPVYVWGGRAVCSLQVSIQQ